MRLRLKNKHLCRWLDGCMDCCRHPSTYERMEKLGVFAEFKCRCRKGCGFEQYDDLHPMWWDRSKEADGMRQVWERKR